METTNKPKRRRRRRRKQYLQCDDWTQLAPGTEIKIKQSGGPYYPVGDERVNIGTHGKFTVYRVVDDGLLVTPLVNGSGIYFVYMQEEEREMPGGSIYRKHNILVKNVESPSK